MKPLICFLMFSGCFFQTAFGQRLYQTSSGQKFVLNDDNSWYFVEGIVQSEDTTSDALSSKTVSKYNTLLKKSLENEVGTYVLWLSKNREIALTEMNIKLTKEATNNPEILEKLNNRLLSLKKEENVFLTQYSKNAQLTQRVLATQNMQGKKQEKEWNKIAKILNVKFIENSPTESKEIKNEETVQKKKEFVEFVEDIPQSNNKENTEIKSTPDKVETKPSERSNSAVFIKKRKSDCPMHQLSFDSSLNKTVTEMEAGILFNYTPDKIKSYFKAKDFLTAKASIVRYDKSYVLKLYLTFYSKDAGKTYGYISEGSLITMQLINGALLRLKTSAESRQGLETYTGNTTYSLNIPLDSEAVDMLEKIAVDNMGIMWSSGYETYTIYEVDFLMKQLKCLKKIK